MNNLSPTKLCKTCNAFHPLASFGMRGGKRTDRKSSCRKCCNAALRELRARTKDVPRLIPPMSQKLLTRIFAKIAKSPEMFNGSHCWNWQGYISPVTGYGFASSGVNLHISAHRFVYQVIVEPIPDHLHCDHLCRNKRCVNPAHIEVVTPRVNVLRSTNKSAINARKTHCPQGHEYTESNTYQRQTKNGHGARVCRECSALQRKQRYYADHEYSKLKQRERRASR